MGLDGVTGWPILTPMNLVRLMALLIYTYGAFSFGAILILWIRQMGKVGWGGEPARTCPPRRGADFVGGALTLVSFAWFVCSLLLVLIKLDPRIRPYPLMTAMLVQVFLFPPLIAHTTYVEIRSAGAAPLPPAWRFALAAQYLGCLSAMTFSLLGFYRILSMPEGLPGQVAGISMGVFFSLSGIYSVLAISRYSRRPATASERTSRRWWLGLFSALFLMGVPIVLANVGWIRLSDAMEVGLRSLPLAFLFAGTYFGNRFEFFDVFIKRGLALLVTIVSFTAYFALVTPRLEGLPLAWARPWVYAVALLPVAMALPWAYRKMSAWLDNVWLGRQFTTVEAVKHFLSGIQSAITVEELVREAETRIGEIMHAPVRILLGEAGVPEAPDQRSLEIPIGRRRPGAGSIFLGRRASQVPYFSQDVVLLESLAEVFAYMLENVRLQKKRLEQDRREQELSLHASRSELKALRAQINPHFLFNALNAIAGLIPKDPARADRAVEQLAEVFRYTLRRSESEWTRLGEEMEAVRAYMELEQARFGSRLQCRVTVNRAVEDARIPTLVVQTLVENAVKHGVAAIRGPGRIDVEAGLSGDAVEVSVSDNGPGFPEGADSGRLLEEESPGFGLKNIRERLRGHFGERASLEILRDAGGQRTTVRLRVPLKESGRESRAGSELPGQGAAGAVP